MRYFFGAILIVICTGLHAQLQFRIRVPQKPIIVGEAFRVEYVAEGFVSFEKFISPDFSSFKLVRGPEVYEGSSTGSYALSRNTTYVLEAIRPGRFKIPGTIAEINSKQIKCNDAWVEVILAEQDDRQRVENGVMNENTAYLGPGEDPYQKIRQNLFVKVLVNKKSCFPGEAIVATFKLYSRLNSKSEIAKNPGFYGFSVHDMIGLNDKILESETINGKKYDVHTIRKVQLYPLQSGQYVIDPMEINNRVEFSRSYVDRKPEQEITEGSDVEKVERPKPGVEVYESSVRTEPIEINVKSNPAKNKPATYNGATGQFTIDASFQKPELAKNEEGFLLLTIKGKGNFSQVAPPTIQWPAGIEGFDPIISESIDVKSAPLNGYKTFRYPFVSAKSGNYTIQPVVFSYFNPDSGNYKTVSGNPGALVITNEEVKAPDLVPSTNKKPIGEINKTASKIAAGIIVGLLIIVLVYWVLKKKEPAQPIVEVEETPTIQPPSIAEILEPAKEHLNSNDRDFYSTLHQIIWTQVSQHFNLSGTDINKSVLKSKLRQIGFEKEQDLLLVIQQCGEGMFTTAILDINKEELIDRVQILLEKLRENHSAYL